MSKSMMRVEPRGAPSATSDTSDTSDYEDDQPEVDEYGNYVTPPPNAELPECDLPPPPKALPSTAIYQADSNTSNRHTARVNKRGKQAAMEAAWNVGLTEDHPDWADHMRGTCIGQSSRRHALDMQVQQQKAAERAQQTKDRVFAIYKEKRSAKDRISTAPQ